MQTKDKTTTVSGTANATPKEIEPSAAMDGASGPSTAERRPPQLPVFFNRLGVDSIEIGVAAFDCIGVLPPHDHPHVYLNMGEQGEIRCPYCSTQYRFNPALSRNETIPPGCFADNA